MSRSNIIFGTLCLAFVIYITLRGQLPEYLGLFSASGGDSHSTSNGASGSTGGGNSAPSPSTTGNSLGGTLATVASFPKDMQDTIDKANTMLSTMGLPNLGK